MLIMSAKVCSDLWSLWQLLGWVLTIFKIVIPILIIVFGMIDLGKAVIASKDDEIKKSLKSLAMRIVAGVVIFFIPTIVAAVFKIVDGFQDPDVQGEFTVCSTCITHPSKCNSSATSQAKCPEGQVLSSEGNCVQAD